MAKWPLLMAWRRVLQTGRNSVTWYHCADSVLVLAAMALRDACVGGIGGWPGMLVRLYCHMPNFFNRVPSNTVRPSFTKLR